MNSNEQEGANFDDFRSFGHMFRSAFQRADQDIKDERSDKTYDEILEEYEKFFNLNEQVLKDDENSKSNSRKYNT